LQGFAYMLFYTASLIYATRKAARALQGTIVGIIEAVGAFAIAFTPFIALFLRERYGYPTAFEAAALTALAAVLTVPFLTRCPVSPVGEEKPLPPRLRLISVPALLPGLVAASLFFVAVSYVNLAPLVAQHLAVANIGLYLALRAICTVPTRLMSGYVADRQGPSWVILPGMAAAALAMLLLPIIQQAGCLG
jgi:predicted MFS family arabinose efflux permease